MQKLIENKFIRIITRTIIIEESEKHLQRTTGCANDIVSWIQIMFCMIAGGASIGGHTATSQLEWYRYGIVFSIKKDLWRTR